MIDWPEAINLYKPAIVKISTPRGMGTGFIIASSKVNNICGIATASHVVSDALYWEEPIRIEHLESRKSIIFHNTERVILLKEELDTAAILVNRSEGFPERCLPIIPAGKSLKVGHEVGWLGFPALSPNNLCFFTGRISCYITSGGAYFVDGVIINGVSGGPAFHLATASPVIIGIVSAYIVNRATGGTLPGLGVIRDIQQFQKLIQGFQSMDEAKKQETSPTMPPSPKIEPPTTQQKPS